MAKRRIRNGWKLALSGLLTPGIIAWAAFWPYGAIQVGVIIYAILWGLIAFISLIWSATNGSNYTFFIDTPTYKELINNNYYLENKNKQLQSALDQLRKEHRQFVEAIKIE